VKSLVVATIAGSVLNDCGHSLARRGEGETNSSTI